MQLAAAPAAASALKGGSSIFKGISAFQQGKFQQRLAERNADIANQRAGAAAEVETRAGEKTVGAAAARAGASGFDLSGSASDVMAQLASESSQRARTSIFDGNIRAQSFREQGEAAASQGRAALFGGVGKAVGIGVSLLGKSSGKFKDGS